jgi:hypothetical protein
MIFVVFMVPKFFFDIDYNYYSEPFYTEIADDKLSLETTYIPTNRTIHYTFVFNTFVLMQLFNEFNSRKVGAKDFNIF